MPTTRHAAEDALARIDWTAVDAVPEEALEAIIAADPDDVLLSEEELARPVPANERPAPKAPVAPAAE
jgi:hypothetical protein